MEKREHRLEITDLAFGGDGVGRIENMVCFVPYTVPGDVISVELLERKKNYLRGRLVEVLSPSQWRTEPVCPYFGNCGGCQWQHVHYAQQLSAKKRHLSHILKRITGLDFHINDLIPSPDTYNYRRVSRMQVGKKGELGFYRGLSNEIVPIDSCSVFEGPLNSLIPGIRDILKKKNALPSEVELISRKNEGPRFTLLYPGHHSEQGFIQANREVNRQLQECVYHWISSKIGSANLVLDLYCGDGNLSLPLQDLPVIVHGYDISAPSVERACRTVREEGLSGFSYETAPLQKVMKKIAKGKQEVGAVICDPPRQGLGNLAPVLSSIRAPLFIYISCIPSVLARDLRVFLESGYSVDCIQPLDMFPQTFHLETAVLLVLNPGGNT